MQQIDDSLLPSDDKLRQAFQGMFEDESQETKLAVFKFVMKRQRMHRYINQVRGVDLEMDEMAAFATLKIEAQALGELILDQS